MKLKLNMELAEISILISFATFVAVLLFNVIEFRRIAKRLERLGEAMEQGFRMLSEDHKRMMECMMEDHKSMIQILERIAQRLEFRHSKQNPEKT